MPCQLQGRVPNIEQTRQVQTQVKKSNQSMARPSSSTPLQSLSAHVIGWQLVHGFINRSWSLKGYQVQERRPHMVPSHKTSNQPTAAWSSLLSTPLNAMSYQPKPSKKMECSCSLQQQQWRQPCTDRQSSFDATMRWTPTHQKCR